MTRAATLAEGVRVDSEATTPAADGPWTTPLDELVPLLDLAERDRDEFEAGHSRAAVHTGHVFGGLVAAQALVAAARTVEPARRVHSLHAYFLRRGDASVPITLQVERTRDGGSFSHRRVTALQHGRAIVELASSFARPLEGVAHQLPAPDAPQPEEIRPEHDVLAELGGVSPYATNLDAFELRTAGLGPDWYTTKAPVEESTLVWKRTTGPVAADPVLLAALFTYASDMRILHPILRPHALSMMDGGAVAATIDHAVWFHRPPRPDAWTLWVNDSPWAGDGRGLGRTSVYDADGTLVATVAQEGLIRIP